MKNNNYITLSLVLFAASAFNTNSVAAELDTNSNPSNSRFDDKKVELSIGESISTINDEDNRRVTLDAHFLLHEFDRSEPKKTKIQVYGGVGYEQTISDAPNVYNFNYIELLFGVSLTVENGSQFFFEEVNIQTESKSALKRFDINGKEYRLGIQRYFMASPIVLDSGTVYAPYYRASLLHRDLWETEKGFALEVGVEGLSMSYQYFSQTKERKLGFSITTMF